MSSATTLGGKRAVEDDPLLLVRRLRQECREKDACVLALDTISTLLRNVLEHPEDERYRTVRLANALFQRRVGVFPSGLALLRAFGFEDAEAAGAGEVTHLALPTAEASDLARGLVLLQAAKEALALVDADVGTNPAVRRRPNPEPALHEPPAASYTRAEGKRPARREEPAPSGVPGPAGSSAQCVGTAQGSSPPELTDFSAAGIERFFVEHAGDECVKLADEEGAASFDGLVQAATDAARVAMDDADAVRAAERWVRLLAEHGALMGWRGGSGEAGGSGARESDVLGFGDGADEGNRDASGDSEGGDEEAAGHAVGSDGNFDFCAECGVGGDLICCDECPQVFHAECLGPFAPPPEDDSPWYCPQCAKGFGM